ncbi:putative DUF723 domain-containing protein [Vibrio phage 141O35-1]|nr:putative DUF723 domain-containing protein [Vibrio phage 141O35-1]CAH9015506.1 putative DUF723 domain-containing protein [Vibrio phage 141E35-1]
MPRRLTTEEFIEKARATHGGKYSYEHSVYITGRRKVIITCPEHGDFEQRPSDHVNGDGCSKCSGKHRYTTEEFVEKALTVHDGKYSYERSVYISNNKNIIITCPEHGDFEQTAKGHLRGRGCITCGGRKKVDTIEFIEKAREVHGGKYDYAGVNYLNNKTDVVILCPKHGSFNQRPDHHLSGIGCPSCAGNFIKTTKQFIEEAVHVHGGTYSYDRAAYGGSKKKVTITCPEHGDFEQTPSGHLQGKGCYLCSPGGFNSSQRSYLYILLDMETYNRVKIGISNSPNNRIRFLRENTPFSIERIDLFETPPEITLQIEKFCHSQLDSAKLQGFNGATEWFKFDGSRLEALRTFIRSCGGVPR